MGAVGALERDGIKMRSGRGEGAAEKGGRGVGEAKRKRRQSIRSATVRHAGMCPAAAAELEYEYRPGQVWGVSVALYCYIRCRGSYILIQCTMILSTYDC